MLCELKLSFLRLLIAFCGLTRIEFLRREVFRRDPPVCFMKVFEIAFLNACLGDFLLPTTSKISGRVALRRVATILYGPHSGAFCQFMDVFLVDMEN